jgi:PhzF family phenazine biosynthesis protein
MRAYKVVDVFTSKPLLGNPVAVILDAEGLSDSQMQAIAGWTNLSETTFVLPAQHPDADYRLRIFTPRSELPFAGHPTLGSAHAIVEAGRAAPRDGVLVQECGVGLVNLKMQGDGAERIITLALPAAEMRDFDTDEVDELEAILGQPVSKHTTPAVVNVGVKWIVAAMADATTVLGLTPDFARSSRFETKLGVNGITVFGPHASGDAEIEVRSFAPSCSIEEDPVCGSGNGSVAVFRSRRNLLPPSPSTYVAAQGQRVGRDGRVAITLDENGQISVGGCCVTCVNGTLAY